MANVFTGATSAAGSGQMSNQVITAYDRDAFFALRAGLVFDQFARVKPGNLTNPGTPVSFLFWSDMSAATTALTETVDVDAVGLSDSTVTVTPAEYGNAVLLTRRLQVDDYLIGFDADVANLISWNLVDTVDTLARTAMDGATNVEFMENATTASDVVATDIITSNKMREKNATLKSSNVVPWDGSMYVCVLHPDVAYDLKSETGDGGWLWPHQYVDTANIYANEIGIHAGFKVMETSRANLVADGASSTVDLYTSYFFGREHLAKAESIPPHIVVGPVTDKLRRFQPLGWHAYVGWDTLRQAAQLMLKSASSIGSN